MSSRFTLWWATLERCPSGLRSTPGKRVYVNPYRGFESLSLRQRSALCAALRVAKVWLAIVYDVATRNGVTTRKLPAEATRKRAQTF